MNQVTNPQLVTSRSDLPRRTQQACLPGARQIAHYPSAERLSDSLANTQEQDLRNSRGSIGGELLQLQPEGASISNRQLTSAAFGMMITGQSSHKPGCRFWNMRKETTQWT